jgi:cyanate lyase
VDDDHDRPGHPSTVDAMTDLPDRLPEARHPHTPLLDRASDLGVALADMAHPLGVAPAVVAAWLGGTVPIPDEHRDPLADMLQLKNLNENR